MMNDARSDASHTIASATSSGRPTRLRGASTPKRASNSAGVMPSSCERLRDQLLQSLGCGEAGPHIVDGDTVFAELIGEALDQTENTGAHCIGVDQISDWLTYRHGGNRHQPAPVVFLHPGQNRTGKVDHAHEVHFHCAMPLVGGGGKKHLRRRSPGIGHANVDAAELLRHALHKCRDCNLIGYIEYFGEHPGLVAFTNLGRSRVELLLVARAHGNVCAFGGKLFCCRSRDAIARRSDNDIAVLQSKIQCCASPLGLCFLPQIGIVFVDPILTGWIEDVQVDRILKRDRFMRHVGWNAEHFPRGDREFPVVDVEVQGAFEDIGDLLIVMAMQGHPGALLQQDARGHHIGAHDHLPAYLRAQWFNLDIVPLDVLCFRHSFP